MCLKDPEAVPLHGGEPWPSPPSLLGALLLWPLGKAEEGVRGCVGGTLGSSKVASLCRLRIQFISQSE